MRPALFNSNRTPSILNLNSNQSNSNAAKKHNGNSSRSQEIDVSDHSESLDKQKKRGEKSKDKGENQRVSLQGSEKIERKLNPAQNATPRSQKNYNKTNLSKSISNLPATKGTTNQASDPSLKYLDNPRNAPMVVK